MIDADAIARAVTAPGGLAIAALRQAFGDDFITPAGALDRERMRRLAFTDADAKKRLEAIVHPLVSQETWRQATLAEAAGRRCLTFDIPLLVESRHWRQKVDQILVIDCTPETQISRVMARNALLRPAVQAIINAQASREQRLKAADAVIFNEAISLEELGHQIRALAPGFGLSLTHHQDTDQ